MTEEIRDLIGRYLAGELSATDLARQLPDGWDLDESGDRDARALVLRVVGSLSELQNGDLSEDGFRERLGILIPSNRAYWRGQVLTRSGSTATRRQEAAVPAGRSREVAPA
jgi:hypothetical protein